MVTMKTTKIQRTFVIIGVMTLCTLALSAVAAPDAWGQTFSVGVRGGVLTGEIGIFGEFLLTPSISMNLSLGIQSASFSLATWSTIYLLPSNRTLAPYLSLGAKFLFARGTIRSFLQVMGGLRFNPPPIPVLSVFSELALFIRLPAFDQAALDARFGLALRF
jgi:hypothetical protein